MTTTTDAREGTSHAGRWDRATVTFLAGYFAGSAGLAALATALGKQVYDLSGRELDLGLLGLAELAPAALLVLVGLSSSPARSPTATNGGRWRL